MTFDESVKYLFNLGNEVLTMKLGLENIRTLLAALGNPENNYLKIQVAGTNGKGSTCAFLDAISHSAEIKTGLYTSPHLIAITERIKINGAEISETDFARHATKIREISETLVEKKQLEFIPTFFEQVTAIALTAFAEAKIKLAILETGLGGRFDATTAANAEIVAITPIDFDHQDILGNTLKEIAAEKAAIIREDTKVIVGNQKAEALEVIIKKCAAEKVVPIIDNCEVFAGNAPKLKFKTKNNSYSIKKLGLEGKHQLQNACTAINLAEVLREDFNFQILDSAIAKGLEIAKHAGRLEWRNVENIKILFDGAHNVAGAKALKNYLDEFVSRPIIMIFGAMRDKDLEEIAKILFPKAENLIFTVPDNPRSISSEELENFLPKEFDRKKVFLTDTVFEAIEKAKSFESDNQMVLITGSLYLVGEAQKIINLQSEI